MQAGRRAGERQFWFWFRFLFLLFLLFRPLCPPRVCVHRVRAGQEALEEDWEREEEGWEEGSGGGGSRGRGGRIAGEEGEGDVAGEEEDEAADGVEGMGWGDCGGLTAALVTVFAPSSSMWFAEEEPANTMSFAPPPQAQHLSCV